MTRLACPHATPSRAMAHSAFVPRIHVFALPVLLLWAAPAATQEPDAARPPTAPVNTVVGAEAAGPAIDAARAAVVRAAERGAGVGVAVIEGGEAVWVEGVGWSSLDTRTPVDPTGTRFRIYSVAKPMTAVAVGRLMERGALDPSADVRQYVPELPDHGPITSMQLATHTSGIRHYADQAEATSTRHCEGVADALPIFVDDPLVHAPGAGETYSSWGYVLLSAVVEGVADTGFVAAMEELLFDPVGMEGMAVDDPTVAVPGRATFYAETDGAIEPAAPVDNTCKWGAGAFVATPYDVAAFGASMLGDELLSPRTIELFFRGQDVYRAQGVGTGGVAFLVVDRARDLVVALVANTAGETAGPAAQEALGEVYRVFAERARRR